MLKRVIKGVMMVCVAIVLVFGGVIGVILIEGLNDTARESDVGIVLGSRVMSDGTPSSRLRARLDEAANLYHKKIFKRIIVSGGIDPSGHNEAQIMAAYMFAQQHIPREDILLDEYGNTTQDTARNSVVLMKQQGLSSAVVVTQYFHIARSRYALHQAGLTTVYTAHARYFESRDLYSIVREAIALPVYWVMAMTQ
jgi:vancomycin permeability regulator SanA